MSEDGGCEVRWTEGEGGRRWAVARRERCAGIHRRITAVRRSWTRWYVGLGLLLDEISGLPACLLVTGRKPQGSVVHNTSITRRAA